jgi:hypothetical protein
VISAAPRGAWHDRCRREQSRRRSRRHDRSALEGIARHRRPRRSLRLIRRLASDDRKGDIPQVRGELDRLPGRRALSPRSKRARPRLDTTAFTLAPARLALSQGHDRDSGPGASWTASRRPSCKAAPAGDLLSVGPGRPMSAACRFPCVAALGRLAGCYVGTLDGLTQTGVRDRVERERVFQSGGRP